MHVSQQLFVEAFEAHIDGKPVGPETMLPDWAPLDRFGMVVSESLGGLGASLLLQLAIAQFYAVKPDRRVGVPTYPEIYMFHVGGPHGDFSNFDFWPPRKEIRQPDSDPLALLEAINAHGITRLALPSGTVGTVSVLGTGPSTWAEQASAVERLRSCFVYAADGRLAGGDVRLSSRDIRVRENITATLDPLAAVAAFREELASGATLELPGPTIASDVYRWADEVATRVDEVSAAAYARAARMYAARIHAGSGELTEVYRRITAAEALARIAGVF